MSVVQGQRGRSFLQSMEDARQLEIYTLQICQTLERHSISFLAQPISELSILIYSDLKKNHSIVPNSKEDWIKKKQLTESARLNCNALDSQIGILFDTCNILEERQKLHWLSLLTKVMDSIDIDLHKYARKIRK